MSTAITAEALNDAVANPNWLALFISRNQPQAQHLMSYARSVVRHRGYQLTKDREGSMTLANGSRLISLPATRDTARGYDADHVYLDEFAYAPYDEDIFAAARPTITRGGRITVLSTPRGRNNLFFRIWAGLEASEWSRHAVPWSKCPVYDDAWAERERESLPARRWAQEYECDFTESGAARFRIDDIANAHEGATGLIAQPVEGHKYVSAWDIGRHRDATVGGIIDISNRPYQLVGFQRFTGVPYPRIQSMIDNVTRLFRSDTIIDSTGAGDPVLENLTAPAQGFVFTQRSKVQALDALSMLLERGLLKMPYIRQVEEELIGYEDADKDLVQDCVMMLAIAATRCPVSMGRILA